uniref:BBSome interacting protein 1 n=1 Tax=Anolis carolinensis TaxID=28377 RepID=G1KRM1_ANOCA
MLPLTSIYNALYLGVTNISFWKEILPHRMLAVEDVTTMVLCKPKLLPLKSVTLEKLEKMQREAQETIRQQELAQQSSKSIE